MAEGKQHKPKVWNKLKDAVNRTSLVRRISVRKSSRSRPYGNDGEESEEPGSNYLYALLAQVYSLFIEGEQQRWEKLIEEVVRISVTLEQESPKYVFHISTVDADLQGVLDTYISVPGAQLVRCTSSFVQWKDAEQGGAWGLNFISDDAAEKFIALCTPIDNPKLKRCSSSSDLPAPADYPDTDLGDVVLDGLAPDGPEPVSPTMAEGSHKKQLNLPLSGSVRRLLSPRSGNSGNSSNSMNGSPSSGSTNSSSKARSRDIKYATYSSSRKPRFAQTLYDNVSDGEEDEDYRCNANADALALTGAYIDALLANGDGVSGFDEADSAPTAREDCVTPTPMNILNLRRASCDATPEQQQPRIVVKPVGPGRDANCNAGVVDANWEGALGAPVGLPGEGAPDIGWEGGLRPRSNTTASRTSSNGSSRGSSSRSSVKRRSSRKSKIKSLIVGGGTDGQSDVQNTQDHLADTHSLLQAYEFNLRNLSDAGTDPGTDDATFPSKPPSSRRSSSFKLQRHHQQQLRRGDSETGGSSTGSGLVGEFGTLASSEGRYSQGTDEDFMDMDMENLKNLPLKDEDVDDDDSDSHSFTSHHTQASAYTQRGAIRKAGWLHCKSLLVQKKKRVERAANRKWKEYWVCLKGTMLLFYHCEDKTTPDENTEPRHILVVEGGIAQAIPEHPKRDNIFCLSTAFGDAYLFQSHSQNELENWITGIHSACASALARQHGKDNTIHLLKSETHKLESQIESETKMKKMAELQLNVVTQSKSRQAIVTQIAQWDQNLERFHLELYRLRCYLASLQGSELPNPKTLLACVSRPTKLTLAKLDFFSVSSFHALVSARNPISLQGRFSKPRSKKQKGLFGTLKRASKGATALAVDAAKLAESHGNTAPPVQFEEAEQRGQEQEQDGDKAEIDKMYVKQFQEAHRADAQCLSEQLMEGALVKVILPDNQSTMVTLRPGMTVHDLLISSCVNRQMDYHNYYVRFNQALRFGSEFKIPDKCAVLEKEKFDEIYIFSKCIHQVELYKFSENMDYGFTVEAELGDDVEKEDQLCVFISGIEKGGLAYHQDLHVGDELLCIEGRVVCELDMLFIENLLLDSSSVTLTVRSSRTVFAQTQAMLDTNRYIDQLTCPPPPSQSRLTDDMIDTLIIPAPNTFDESDVSDVSLLSSQAPSPLRFMYDPVEEELQQAEEARQWDSQQQQEIEQHPKQIEVLLKGVEQITDFCRTMDYPKEQDEDGRQEETSDRGPVKISDEAVLMQSAQKLRKVIYELLETERAYVKDLNLLVSRYLEPLQNESFLTADEIDALFGNIKEIIRFQTGFLKSLEDATDVPDYATFNNPTLFSRVLFAMGGAFLFYMDHFKLYSAFCACHSRSQKILDPARGNRALMEFLGARNPKNQHSSSLESYLIKPIQRVLKYPLLLSEMRSQLDGESNEHYHLSQALKGMSKVAGHINDMMRVHEEFGDIFDGLVSEQYHVKKEVTDLAMDDLVLYNNALWLNSQDDLGKCKRGKEPEVTVFVFRLAVVIICKEKTKKQRKSVVKVNLQLTDDFIRFKWMIPVSAMQVKDASINDSDYLSLWELAHTKSEGKTEKLFQFSCSTSEQKSLFVRTIKQVMRDHKYNKNSSVGSKFTAGRPKNYTPYSGKRLEGLSHPKRTLRKSLQRGSGGSSEGSRPEGSQCSEERSSGSGSTKGDRSEADQYESLETDSSGTGQGSSNGGGGGSHCSGLQQPQRRRPSLDSGMHSNDSSSLAGGSGGSSGSANTNINNNVRLRRAASSEESESALGSPRSPQTPLSEGDGWPPFSLPSPAALSTQEIQARLAMMELAVAQGPAGRSSPTAEPDIATANRTLGTAFPAAAATPNPKRIRRPKAGQRGSLYDNMRCDSVEEEIEDAQDPAGSNMNPTNAIPGACNTKL